MLLIDTKKFIFLWAALCLSASAAASSFQFCCADISSGAAAKEEKTQETAVAHTGGCHGSGHQKNDSAPNEKAQKKNSQNKGHLCSMPCCLMPLTDRKSSRFKFQPAFLAFTQPISFTTLKLSQFTLDCLKPPIG